MSKMNCNWCQEAIDNVACTKGGFCGKTTELANLMDIHRYYLSEVAKLPKSREIDLHLMNGLFKMITNANFDEKIFLQEINKSRNYLQLPFLEESDIRKLSVNVIDDNQDLESLKKLVLTGLMGMAAYHSHASNNGTTSEEIFEFTRSSLVAISQKLYLAQLLDLVNETGLFGVKVMELLDQTNNFKYGSPVITSVNLGVRNRPGILISGHDLNVLEQLLEQTDNIGIDIYTHCEMLPAHYYPKLNKYEHLYANYGNAWWQQEEEFSKFNGPILFTTNCIVPPKKNANYRNRVYTVHNAGHADFKHLTSFNDKYDFSEIIATAKNCAPPIELEKGELVGGFAHQQIMEVSDKIIESIKDGSIEKFVVMAGCDGRHTERKYYENFAKNTNDKTVILTAGCAKFRYNKLNLQSVNGIPKVLDAGQCNDSYSLAVVALNLAKAFELENINDLPIEYNIAWYEQKAIIVLLALLSLGVKNINLGPTLPAFITPNIANFLIETYNISNDLS